MKRKNLSMLIAAGALAATPMIAGAQQQQQQPQRFADQLYFGAGATWNDLDQSGWDDALGFQLFVGWDPGFMLGRINGALEVGYMSSGDFDRDIDRRKVDFQGVWANAVGRVPIAQDWHALARIGADFGDDDGPMFGVGVGYNATPAVDIRGEYVMRDEIDSLQLNLTWRPYIQ